MNAKHTPAPWRVFTDDNECGLYHVRTPGRAVAEPEDEANARLIAAAPELLESLQAVLAMDVKGHSLLDRLQFSTEGRALSEKCMGAIAKAKGEL
jgi:hypothetical protein